jgi:hypothetical protein
MDSNKNINSTGAKPKTGTSKTGTTKKPAIHFQPLELTIPQKTLETFMLENLMEVDGYSKPDMPQADAKTSSTISEGNSTTTSCLQEKKPTKSGFKQFWKSFKSNLKNKSE